MPPSFKQELVRLSAQLESKMEPSVAIISKAEKRSEKNSVNEGNCGRKNLFPAGGNTK